MTSQTDHEASLREAIRTGNAVVVAGTGVSIAASFDATTRQSHPQASWAGLLENGLQWLKDHKLMEENVVEAQLELLRNNPPTHRCISAAEDIVNGMGTAKSQHFCHWLNGTVGSIKAHDGSVLDALDAIRKNGNLLATTNYDGLLLESSRELVPVTWRDSAAIIDAVRRGDTEKIIFLHGYWRQPESVILDWKSYDQVARDGQYRDDLAAFWKTRLWVYVGCGVNGLSDPDFRLLLERYGERARRADHWDYCLVCEDQRADFQAEFDSKKFNIRAISFGEKHSDLPTFLHSLLPGPIVQAPPNAAAIATAPGAESHSAIPQPPAFYAVPDYIGRFRFVGRQAQLKILSDWAQPTDTSSILLFGAIGGNGKSMLTWEWATKHATAVRTDWAGCFWYSFYEKGAVMQQFCQHALAYMTQQPLMVYEKKSMSELCVELLAQLRARPWLLIIDGLERVLVAYHRIDAAEVPDEEVNRPTDKVLSRDPLNTIRDEDTDLLRALAADMPSKILISSRLIPRAVMSPGGLPLPNVKVLELPGLEEMDAEQLLRSCGIQGASVDIRYYLKTYCGNHPLVIGVLAGLINSPGPHRGDFDAWATDPDYGAKLNLASLDLIQRRNHILRAALDALDMPSRQLLSALALISSAVDYETVAALNPHLPPEPKVIEEPTRPESKMLWSLTSEVRRAKQREQYESDLAKWKAYNLALQTWRESEAVREAPKRLVATMQNLEQRGLLYYEAPTRRYDLHPVVRGVAAGSMKKEDTERYGQRVVDYYSSQPHDPYENARTMEDVENGLHLVRTLLKLSHYEQAVAAFRDDLGTALLDNLEAYIEILALLRPLFPSGWDRLPMNVDNSDASYLAGSAAIALYGCREYQQASSVADALLCVQLKSENWGLVHYWLRHLLLNLFHQHLQAKSFRVMDLSLALANVREENEEISNSRSYLFVTQVTQGYWQDAEVTYRLLNSTGVKHRTAEMWFLYLQFFQGYLEETQLTDAIVLAEQECRRFDLRELQKLRGMWLLEQGDRMKATASFTRAIMMAHERRLRDVTSETGLALAKHYLGELTGGDAHEEAERLSQLPHPSHYYLAMLWRNLDDLARAKMHALEAYKLAWADGEPYVNRYLLTKSIELLKQMSVPVPVLPPYDPEKDEPFPWEADIREAIEKLRAKKEAKEKEKQQELD